MASPQYLDPKLLLAPKAGRAQAAPAAAQRQPANSFQTGMTSTSTTPAGATDSSNGYDGHDQVNGFYDRMHNLERRHEPAPKRRKLQETNGDEDDMTHNKKAEHQQRGSGGVIGEFFEEKKQEAQAKQGSTSKVVDLTEDQGDDELVVVSDNQNREVCVGKIDGAQVNAHRIPHPGKNSMVTQKVWPAQKVTLARRPGLNTHIISVIDASGRDFGTIDVKTASVLAPLMDYIKTSKIRIHARLDMRPRDAWEMPGQSISKHYPITLIVYCPYNMVNGTGRAFSQKNIFLRDPQQLPANVELVNPHTPKDHAPRQKALVASTSRYSGNTQVTRTQEEVRQDVFRMFDSIKQTEDLPQREQPKMIKTPLLSHQKQALYFMTEREKDKRNEAEDESSLWHKQQDRRGRTSWYHVITGHETMTEPEPVLGGILADVMGLGKTLNVLSLICDTREEASAFGKGVPPKPQFEGDRADLAFNNRATLLVCPLSTVANWEEQIKQHIRHGNPKFDYIVYHGPNRTQDPENLTDFDMVITSYTVVAADSEKRSRNRPRDPLGETHWFRIVLDEGHVIRGQQTRQSKAVCALSAERRWAVTGTPVQNRLEDLGALMKFLRIRPFDEPRNFAQSIIAPFKTADTEIIPKLRLLVDSITLRRLKDKIDLPKREEVVNRLEMADSERDFYNYFAQESTRNIEVMVKQKEKIGGKTYAHVLKAILRMRLLCAGGSDLLSDEDWDAAQGISLNTAIDLETIDDKPERTSRQAFELYRMMKDADVNACARCSRIIEHKEIQEPDTEEDESDESDDDSTQRSKDHTFGFLAQCNQLICAHCIGIFKEECNAAAGHDNHGHCPLCETYTKFAFFPLTQRDYESDEAAIRAVRDNPHLARKAGRYSGPSAKTRALIQALQCDAVVSEKMVGEPPIKSVIFSGWTTHLDLIQLALTNAKIRYVRLDGSLGRKQRSEVLAAFSNNPDVTCILVSISAGGLGLNLTAASRVFVMEPQFNPAAEAQAIERVHRLGQKREVIITKYIMQDSFEEKMLDLQKKKRDLADMSMEKGVKYDKEDKAKRKMEELRTLFK
ncbi:MAG: hypothetical protein Q9162_002268 [Coniocarpon cinnabarinum]